MYFIPLSFFSYLAYQDSISFIFTSEKLTKLEYFHAWAYEIS